MEIFKKIAIKNYRGLHLLEFIPKSINIIVGRNNTGKSAILEAISLLASSTNNFKDLKGEDLLQIFKKRYDLSYLIRLGMKKAEIGVTVDNQNYTLSLEYLTKGIPHDRREKDIFHYIENLAEENIISNLERWERYLKDFAEITEAEKEQPEGKEGLSYIIDKKIEQTKNKFIERFINSSKLILTLSQNNKYKKIFLYIEHPKEELPAFRGIISYRLYKIFNNLYKIDISEDKDFKIPILFNFQEGVQPTTVEELHDLVVSHKKINKALELLKQRVGYIEDIRKAGEKLLVFQSYTDPLPLSAMGDGFISLLKLIFLISLAEQGIIILEEPEVSLHPGFSEILAESIVSNADSAQFFISTHSIDLIELILEKAEQYGRLKNVNILRLHWREDLKTIEKESLSGDQAKEELDSIGTDLRGY
ncbi:MAG: ATP-binding protein [Thermoplasmata archaeon]|nr:ATP-binding protein [Thermoplasmata archaeon]